MDARKKYDHDDDEFPTLPEVNPDLLNSMMALANQQGSSDDANEAIQDGATYGADYDQSVASHQSEPTANHETIETAVNNVSDRDLPDWLLLE
jgi:hypothetical protein